MSFTGHIAPGTTVTLKDGTVLAGREWGDEQEAVVMAVIAKHKNGCATAPIAAALGRGIPETRNYLYQLLDRGKLENIGTGSTRAVWQRLETSIDDFLVVDAHKPRIREYLTGRAELPGKIASDLGLPKDEVTETCKAMMLAGELTGTRIGASFVYRVDVREQVRQAQPEELAALPVSEGQRFQREMEVLRARTPEPTYQKKTYVARTPPAPDGWVMLPDLARETKTGRDTVNAWLKREGHEAITYLAQSGRVGKFVGPEVAQAYRESRTAPPPRATPAQEGILTALREAGPSGLTWNELVAATGREVSSVRLAMRKLTGQVEKCRAGTSRDPTIMRLAEFRGQPWPEARPPALTLKQAAKEAGIGERRLRGMVNRGRIPAQGKGKEALIDAREVDLSKLKPRARARRPQAVKQARETAKEIIPTREGYKIAMDVTRELGIGKGAFYKWVELNDDARRLCLKEGKYLWVPQKVVQMYVERSLPPGATFAATVSGDWLDIWAAVDFLGWSHCKVYKMLAAGKLVAVQCHGKLHFDPGPLRALKDELDAEMAVPAGWMPVQTLCRELGIKDKTSAISWMQRNGHETRKYRDDQKQLAAFISPDGVTAYREHRNKTPGGIKITPQIEAEIRALAECAPRRGKRFAAGAMTAVAEHYGISTASINIVLRRPPTPEVQACTVDVPALLELIWPDTDEGETVAVTVEPIKPIPLPETPTPENSTEQAVFTRPVVTLALEEKIREELPLHERRKPGKTAEVAQKYGLSVKQVRNALARIPVPAAPAHADQQPAETDHAAAD